MSSTKATWLLYCGPLRGMNYLHYIAWLSIAGGDKCSESKATCGSCNYDDSLSDLREGSLKTMETVWNIRRNYIYRSQSRVIINLLASVSMFFLFVRGQRGLHKSIWGLIWSGVSNGVLPILWHVRLVLEKKHHGNEYHSSNNIYFLSLCT